MKPGPAILGGSHKSSTASRADDLGGHVARRAAELLAQRHGEIGLVVAELRVLAGPDHAPAARSDHRPGRQVPRETGFAVRPEYSWGAENRADEATKPAMRSAKPQAAGANKFAQGGERGCNPKPPVAPLGRRPSGAGQTAGLGAR